MQPTGMLLMIKLNMPNSPGGRAGWSQSQDNIQACHVLDFFLVSEVPVCCNVRKACANDKPLACSI